MDELDGATRVAEGHRRDTLHASLHDNERKRILPRKQCMNIQQRKPLPRRRRHTGEVQAVAYTCAPRIRQRHFARVLGSQGAYPHKVKFTPRNLNRQQPSQRNYQIHTLVKIAMATQAD